MSMLRIPRKLNRRRPIVTFTVDATVRAALVALAAEQGISISHALEYVLLRKLDLPPLSVPALS